MTPCVSSSVDASAAPLRAAAPAWRIAVGSLALLLLLAIVRLSWLSDDAFITFRCVENMVAGRGPVWNADDRVLIFVHPLWFWMLCAARLAGDLPTNAQLLGILLSATAVVWLLRSVGKAHAAAMVLALCLASRAWPVFATSGLEPPLTYLLIGALVAAARTVDRERRVTRTAIVVGLLGTTRPDLLLLCGPSFLVQLFRIRARVAIRATLIAAAPLLAWSAFATVYYGSPFPILVYAKLFSHGVPAADLAMQGLRYVWRSVVADPLTPAVILAGIAIGLSRPGLRSLAIGTLLYTAYVVRVGGDYMQGRFLVPPFFSAVAILGMFVARTRPSVAFASIVAAGVLTLLPGVPRAMLPSWPDNPTYSPTDAFIVEEDIRGQWDHGLLSAGRTRARFGSDATDLGIADLDRPVLHAWGAVGCGAYRCGTAVHFVDCWLCDPLLARLPIAEPDNWKIGHFFRRIPAGYLESLASGENRIEHRGLAALWNAVRAATRDPVWSASRWQKMWELWSGRLDAGVADYVATQYRTPPRIEVPIERLREPVPADRWWFMHPASRSAQAGGLTIRLPAEAAATKVTIHVTPGFYDVSFWRDGRETNRERIVAAHPLNRLRGYSIAVPSHASPLDSIQVDGIVPVDIPYAAMLAGIELEP